MNFCTRLPDKPCLRRACCLVLECILFQILKISNIFIHTASSVHYHHHIPSALGERDEFAHLHTCTFAHFKSFLFFNKVFEEEYFKLKNKDK